MHLGGNRPSTGMDLFTSLMSNARENEEYKYIQGNGKEGYSSWQMNAIPSNQHIHTCHNYFIAYRTENIGDACSVYAVFLCSLYGVYVQFETDIAVWSLTYIPKEMTR